MSASNWTERRVVVTGRGAITPLRNDVETLWAKLVAGQCGISKISLFDPAGFDTQIAAEVKDFSAATAFPSPKEARRADRFTQFGVAAGHQALVDSGLNLDKENCDEIGVFLGSGIGGLHTT